MSDNIAFLRESNCNFFSAPSAFENGPGFFLAATKANTLVLTAYNGDKKSLSLSTKIKFDKKEYTKILKLINSQKILIITNKLNVYLMDIDMALFEVTNVKNIAFRYAQNLNVTHLNYNLIKECQDFWLLACGRFLFSFNPKSGVFGLFKVFNDQIVDFHLNSDVRNQIYVLTDKKLYLIKWEFFNSTPSAKVLAQTEQNRLVAVAVQSGRITGITQDGDMEVRDKETLQRAHSFGLATRNSGKIQLSGFLAVNDELLAVHDSEYIYIIAEERNKIQQVINIKAVHCFFFNNQFIDLNRKSENSVKLASLIHHQYTEETRGPKFYKQNLEDRVDLAFSYLAKLFFDMKTVKNFNATIHNMLVELNLGASILKHRRFKEKVMALFNMMKDFTSCVDRTNKVYSVRPVVILKHEERADNANAQDSRGSTSRVLDEFAKQAAI